MIKLPDEINKQIVSFIRFSIRKSIAKDIPIANRNILTHPAISKERIEFYSYGFIAKGINTTTRSYNEDLIIENKPYYNFTIKIRIVSTPEKTMELANMISIALSSFEVVNFLIPNVSILNEKMRSSNLMVSGDGNTSTGYYMYDIDIPSVIEESHSYDLGELVGYAEEVNVEYDIREVNVDYDIK